MEPLEHSVRNIALDDEPVDELSQLEPLEHSVLNVALDNSTAEEYGKPMVGSDSRRTFMKFPDTMRNVDLGLGAAVPLPAGDVGRVALSPAEVRLSVLIISIRRDFSVGTQIEIS